jgi:hypothetical protein
MLGIGAREADIVGIAPLATAGGGVQYQDETHDMLAQKVELARRAAGRSVRPTGAGAAGVVCRGY